MRQSSQQPTRERYPSPLEMTWFAQSAARSRNQVEPVVALLEVLGTRIVEVPATETLTTGGLRASRHANVRKSKASAR